MAGLSRCRYGVSQAEYDHTKALFLRFVKTALSHFVLRKPVADLVANAPLACTVSALLSTAGYVSDCSLVSVTHESTTSHHTSFASCCHSSVVGAFGEAASELLEHLVQASCHLGDVGCDTTLSNPPASTGPLHSAVVESAHPYTPVSVQSWSVKFPSSVQWMTLSFDAKCCTASDNDALRVCVGDVVVHKLAGDCKLWAHNVPLIVGGSECELRLEVMHWHAVVSKMTMCDSISRVLPCRRHTVMCQTSLPVRSTVSRCLLLVTPWTIPSRRCSLICGRIPLIL